MVAVNEADGSTVRLFGLLFVGSMLASHTACHALMVNYLVRRSASLIESLLKWTVFYGSYQDSLTKVLLNFLHGAATWLWVGTEKSHGMKWSHHR